MEQPVVRHRLAKCAAILEAQQAWVESFVYQMTQLPKAQADKQLGGLTALCKANAGIVLDECSRCAVLLFGGNGFTRSGQGELVESKSDKELLLNMRLTIEQKFTAMSLVPGFLVVVRMFCWILPLGRWSRTSGTKPRLSNPLACR